MTALSPALHTAIYSVWNSSGLDAFVKENWSFDQTDRYPSLSETNTAPEQPYPYVVFENEGDEINSRMTGGSGFNYRIDDVPITFHIYARSNGGLSGKVIGAAILDGIEKVFGGHETVTPSVLSMSRGCVIQTTKLRSYHIKEDDDVSHWVCDYEIKTDSKFAV